MTAMRTNAIPFARSCARALVIALPCAMLLAAGPAAAKVKARFIAGQFATEEGCAKLKAIDAGKPRNVETVPDVLTEDGFQGWEGNCEFTQVFEHEPGRVWVGLMVCSEGMTIVPQSYVFIKAEDQSLEVAAAGQDAPEIYKRCEAGKGKKP